MGKALLTVLLCLSFLMSFAQNDTGETLASNVYGDHIYKLDDYNYLDLEFYDKETKRSIGYISIYLGRNCIQTIASLNSMLDVIDDESNDILSFQTRDGELLKSYRNNDGGLEIRFANKNTPYYSVVYRIRIEYLLQKL